MPFAQYISKKIPPTKTFLQNGIVTGANTVYTHTGVNFGTPSPTRQIAVWITIGGPPSAVPTGVTIGGIAATMYTATRMAAGTTSVWAVATVPTGNSGNIVVTSATNGNGCQYSAYLVDGMANLFPVNSFTDNASPFNQSTTVPANGICLAGTTQYIGAGGTSAWSGTLGVVEDCDNSSTTTACTSTASILSVGGVSGTVIVTNSTTNAACMSGLIFS